jgi:Na+/H+ antiporter NhaD/arsenite permease-like protein
MHHAFQPPWFSVLPFVCLLAGIAVFPLIYTRWWELHRSKLLIVALLSSPIALWMIKVDPDRLLHSLGEYVSFIMLLGSLFVISGGIYLAGDLRATPGRNTAILGTGAVLANLIGTTGASMLLIRLILRTNQQRRNVTHIPFFFILIVSNCGGLLTPLGDPPLFLGYLRGVPFTWTLKLWPVWLFTIAYLLGVFWLFDRRAYRREAPAAIAADVTQAQPLHVHGWLNVFLLGGVIGSVFLSSPFREIGMALLGALSYFFGPRAARKKNEFGFGPILEVAVIFVGIFITMIPALTLLERDGASLGLTRPWQFFFVTGALSSVLDNAPTYLTFLASAQSLPMANEVVGIEHAFLVAISCGAVLMGANTYIGNGPNFMVKAIADEARYVTPSFLRYAVLALCVLAPVYALTALYVSM